MTRIIYLDEVAILRWIGGDRHCHVSPRERREGVRRLTEHGLSARQIEVRTGLSARQVQRHLATLRREHMEAAS